MAVTCSFCEIIAHELPGLYGEWRDTVAISPIRPVTSGHLLVVPRQHIENNPQVAALTIERAAILANQHESADIVTGIGSAATEHLCVHVIPRRVGDGLTITLD
jgi:histidine triad (HIT) family protein